MIDFDGKQIGVMLINDALGRAAEKGLDLVELAPQADPPVCKIIDYGKFKYEQQKREKLQKKNQNVSILKEIRLHPNTDVHDFEFKAKHAINFLEEGNKVKVSVMFKGREMAYKEQGEELLARFVEKVEDIAKQFKGKKVRDLLEPVDEIKKLGEYAKELDIDIENLPRKIRTPEMVHFRKLCVYALVSKNEDFFGKKGRVLQKGKMGYSLLGKLFKRDHAVIISHYKDLKHLRKLHIPDALKINKILNFFDNNLDFDYSNNLEENFISKFGKDNIRKSFESEEKSKKETIQFCEYADYFLKNLSNYFNIPEKDFFRKTNKPMFQFQIYKKHLRFL